MIELSAFQVDQWGTVGRKKDGILIRSGTRPTFSFEYETVTYTEKEKTVFYNLERRNLTAEEQEELLRYISTITIDQELSEKMTANAQAKSILEQTDWYVIRKIETDKAIPEDITSMRVQARILCDKD